VCSGQSRPRFVEEFDDRLTFCNEMDSVMHDASSTDLCLSERLVAHLHISLEGLLNRHNEGGDRCCNMPKVRDQVRMHVMYAPLGFRRRNEGSKFSPLAVGRVDIS
jgi:hypothetical protein